MRIDVAITIDADAPTVFGWLASPERATVWMTSVGETEILDERPGLVGTTFREIVRDEKGSVEMRGVVTACEPDRLIGFHLESRVNTVDVEYRIDGSAAPVRLTVRSSVAWRFPVSAIALVAGGRLRRQIAAQTETELERLRALCEAPSTAR